MDSESDTDIEQPSLLDTEADAPSQTRSIKKQKVQAVQHTRRVKVSGKPIVHRDQIHGDISLDKLAVALLDTPALQRLGRIYQLGYAHLVFRGGSHTRLSHVIGACHMAVKLVDALKQNYIYRSECLLPGIEVPQEFLPFPEKKEMITERWQFLRYTTAWAALLHDVGHIPMGHTLEDEFDNIYVGHDDFESVRIPYLWHETEPGAYSDIYKALTTEELYPNAFRKLGVKPKHVWQTVLLICLYKEKRYPTELTFRQLLEKAIEKAAETGTETFAKTVLVQLDAAEGRTFFPYMADIVGNTICADYLDYLRRDPYNVGLDVLWDDRVISSFYVAREDANRQLRMALALLDRNGKRRLDTCTGVLELVRQRFRFAEVIYYHKTKVSASAMFAKALSLIGKPLEVRAQQKVIEIDDIPRLSNSLNGKKGIENLSSLKSSCLPCAMLDPEIGDDSLHLMMQYIAWGNIEAARAANDLGALSKNLSGVALLQAITRRNLYKTRMTIDSKVFAVLSTGADEPNEVERRIGSTLDYLRKGDFERDKLEQGMAEAAGWANHSVLLYVPPRKSQAKGIDTFALQDDGVVTLGMHDAVRAKVKELNNDYKNLWRIVMLVHPNHAKDAIGLSRVVDKMLEELWPEIDFRDEITVASIRSGCWFPYIKHQERLAAEIYSELIGKLGEKPDWECFIRVRHYAVEEGTVSYEEHAYRTYLMSKLDGMSAPEEMLREKFPMPGSLNKLLEDKYGVVEAREGDSGDLETLRTALDNIAEEIGEL